MNYNLAENVTETITTAVLAPHEQYRDYEKIDFQVPFRGIRPYIAGAYMVFNAIGFLSNIWVMYVVAPLICTKRAKVPLSILFYILTLCTSDLMIMFAMLGLIIEIVAGTWKFGYLSCVSYLLFDAMNKFIAPIIVVLISRACYWTICGNVEEQRNAGAVKGAAIQITFAMLAVAAILWPVVAYSDLEEFYHFPNDSMKQVNVMRKCNFQPPPGVELSFSIIGCVFSYAIPLGGFIYWFVSVPFFLRKRASQSLVQSSSGNVAIKRVIRTVLVLTGVYVFSWTPYWMSILAYRFYPPTTMNRTLVFISYFIHLLPYISCCAYPVIFTAMNRGITDAHAKIVDAQRRRFKSMTGDAAMQLRHVYRNSIPVLRRNSASAARSAKFRLRSLAGYSSQSQESSSFAEDRLMGKRQSDGSSATRQSVETVVVLLSSTADVNCENKRSSMKFGRGFPSPAMEEQLKPMDEDGNLEPFRLRRSSAGNDFRPTSATTTIVKTKKTIEWGPETVV